MALSDLKVAAILKAFGTCPDGQIRLIQGLGLRPVIFIGLVLEYFHHGF